MTLNRVPSKASKASCLAFRLTLSGFNSFYQLTLFEAVLAGHNTWSWSTQWGVTEPSAPDVGCLCPLSSGATRGLASWPRPGLASAFTLSGAERA